MTDALGQRAVFSVVLPATNSIAEPDMALLRPPGAQARPGKSTAPGALNHRGEVDRRLVEVRKQLRALRREEDQLVARQQQLAQSDACADTAMLSGRKYER